MEELLEEISPVDERFLDKCSDVTDQIAELLEKKDMTQRDLARKLDKRESYVSRVLSGGVNLTLRTIAELEAALDADLLVTPMYAGRAEVGEGAPTRVLKGATVTHRISPQPVGYEQFKQEVEGTGRTFPSCVFPSANHAIKHFEQSLGSERVEVVDDEDYAIEMSA